MNLFYIFCGDWERFGEVLWLRFQHLFVDDFLWLIVARTWAPLFVSRSISSFIVVEDRRIGNYFGLVDLLGDRRISLYSMSKLFVME